MAPISQLRDPAGHRLWSLVVAVGIAVATWPVASLEATFGIDPSWRLALHMAVGRGLDFGDIAFTYGPLGFLELPLNVEEHTFLPALLWVALLQVGLAFLVIECSRRALTWPGAVALAFVTCRLLDEGREVLPLVAFLWAALVVQWGIPHRLGRILLPVSGALCGLGTLVKLNEGVVAIACAGVAAWWLQPGRWRALGVFAGSTLASILLLWTAMGHGLVGLLDWTVASVRVAAGYSAGLPFEDPPRAWEYPLFILVVVGVAYMAWQGWSGPSRARKIALSLLALFFVSSVFKHGFVRHDLGHTPSSFTALLVLPAAVRWGIDRGARAAAVAATAIAIAGAFVSWGVVTDVDAFGRFLDVSPRLERAGDALELAANPGDRRAAREEAKEALRDHHYIPTVVVDALRGHTVHVEPSETSIIWAYDLDWRPPPAFQDYVILGNALDRSNAEALASSDAPERILRHAGPRVDSHSPEGEGPEQLKAMICHYAPEIDVPGWLVLRRTRSRCGPERTISSLSARAGDEIPIPAPPSANDMVMARLSIGVPPLERLRSMLFKPRALPVVYYGPELRYSIPVAVAKGPLLMRAPASIAWSEYAGGLPYETVRLLNVAGSYRIDFVAVRVGSPAAAR